ncbi:MAG: disulfide bond formation protein B [Alphaproteobacteria bacterium]
MLRAAPLLLALSSLSLLGGAFAFEIFGGLDPCPLCLWQRWPHGAVIILALGAFLLDRSGRRTAAAVVLLAAGGVLAAGVGIAFFHVGVEQGWWPGLAACTAAPAGATVEELAQALASQPASCDQVAWSLLGLSMAAYNGLLSAGLALFALLAAGQRLTTGRRPS